MQKSNSGYIRIVIIGIVLLAGIGAYIFSQTSEPAVESTELAPATEEAPVVEAGQVELEPPESLADIASEVAEEYPDLAELLNNPELESVYKDFYVTYFNLGEEVALNMARQRGLLNENDDVVMTLVLDDPTQAEAIVTQLEAEGIIVVGYYQELMDIVIPTDLILAQIEAEEPELLLERLAELDHIIGLRMPQQLLIQNQVGLGEGVSVTLADEWHTAGITGQGVKVGVLDLGFAGYAGLLGSELPANVTVQTFGNPVYMDTQVHGTAVAEIVHEMAPGAQIFLAYFDGSPVTMGQAVDWLISQGVDIISNSTSISGVTAMDGTGIVAEMVNRADAAGVMWVSAAGNRADEHYRGVFTDSDGDTLHEFAPGVTGIPFTMKAIATNIILTWNDWGAVNQDYDLILYDSAGNLLAKVENLQTGQPGQSPFEVLTYRFPIAGTYLVSIQNRDGQARGDATLDLFIYNGVLPPEFLVAEGSLGTPADAFASLTVGAVHWSTDALEPYSSQGPTNDGRIKPDMVGPSAVKNASYAPSIFDGTSAATPHVAGAAALIMQAQPDLSPAQVAELLKSRAVPLGDVVPSNQFGVGRLNLGDLP